jgi:hypothetical protein
MLAQETTQSPLQIQIWLIDRLVFYARNPRKNDAAVDLMCSSIREFGFKIPVLARSDGEVVDGHLRLKAARKLGNWPGGDTSAIPVILCDEWTPAQVRAFRLMVNRSVTWADWDEELLALEIQELNAAEFDLSPPASTQRKSMICCSSRRTTIEPTPSRRCPRTRCHARATCGSVASTGFCAGTPPGLRTSQRCWAGASRS